ncbi:MAG TPA: histidine kinase, partial [Flavisolibacter sp.]|nr:histidine kinase [Flavisolibacter sp.]
VLTRDDWKFYGFAALGYSVFGFANSFSKYPDAGFFTILLNNVWHLVFVLALNISLFEYALPYLFQKRASVLFNFLLALPVLFFYLLLYSYGLYLWRGLGISLHIYTPLARFTTLSKLLESGMAYSMGSVFLMGIARHIYLYVKLKAAAQQLRIEKQQAELSYLKSQTNPHFLFNTLNNIYALAKEKSNLAPESILRLSKILRFMLYETSGDYISIEQELKIMHDYIELEKLRYDETLFIYFNDSIDDLKQAIPPLLLIPLVENAFKHGVSETRSQPFIDIHLAVKNRQLNFVVKNSSEATGAAAKENIGLSNLRRQLQLLYTDYRLTVKQEQDHFIATLNI